MLVRRTDLDDLYQEYCVEMIEYEPLLRALPADPSGEAFSERLLRMEGQPSPLLGGPIAFVVNEYLLGIDLYNATRRFRDLLEFPSIQGKPANVRAEEFEVSVRDAIDGSNWVSPDSIRRLIGQHFKKNGS